MCIRDRGSYAAGDLSITGGTFEAGTADIFMTNANSAPAKVSGGAYSAQVPADYIVTGSTAASLTSGEETTYFIGTADNVAKTLAEKAAKGDAIAVQQGDVDLAQVAEGVTVANEGDGEVLVNGDAVAKGESAVTQPEATPTPEATPDASAEPTPTPDVDLPKTGEQDGSMIAMLLLLAGAGVVAVTLGLRKRHA